MSPRGLKAVPYQGIDLIVGLNAWDNVEPFLGYLGQMVVLNTALSASDVAGIYNAQARKISISLRRLFGSLPACLLLMSSPPPLSRGPGPTPH